LLNKPKTNWIQQLLLIAKNKRESSSRSLSKLAVKFQIFWKTNIEQQAKSLIQVIRSRSSQCLTLLITFLARLNFLFQSFPIRVKLSLIMGAVVISVVITLSLIVFQSEKRLLRERLDELCDVSVKSLSTLIKGNLLTGKEGDITEIILRIKKLGISGLQDIWVINRDGEMKTYLSLINESNPVITSEQLATLLQLKETRTIETETTYEYYYPIFHKREGAGFEENVFLGVAGLRFSKSEVFAPIKRAQKIIITVMLLIILITVLVIYFLSKRMVLQIQELFVAAKRIGAGDLDVRISIKSRDELGRLGREFNNMVVGLQEKLQMQKFVSKMTVDMIKEHDNSLELSRASKKKTITVLFSDVRSFSTISEKLPPEDVVELINIYLDLQARIVEQNLGILDKFVGDQIMAIFEDENQVRNAMRCAVGIQKSIQELNQKRLKANKTILEVGVGLNTGPAVIGHIGSQARMDYTVVGSTVNVGYHLCANAKPRQIITTLELIESLNGATYQTTKLEPIKIKGKSQPVEIFEIDYDQESDL